MPQNKNQHFVPRAYLRGFTHPPDNKSISLLSIKTGRSIQHAPIKSQCSRDYMYGKNPAIDRHIKTFEDRYGSIRAKILREKQYKLSNSDKTFLFRFWYLQYLRTEMMTTRVQQYVNSLGTAFGQPTISFQEATLLALRPFANNPDAIGDLKACLVRNRSDCPFITSDQPAVLSNRWLFNRSGNPSPSFGVGTSGTIIFLPLSEELLLLGYDGDVYTVSHRDRSIVAKSDGDIAAYNQHQFLNCRSNVFFKNFNHSSTILGQHQAISHRLLGSTHRSFQLPAGANQYAVVQPLCGQPTRWPSQLRNRDGGSVYTNGSMAGYVRRSIALQRGGCWKEAAFP